MTDFKWTNPTASSASTAVASLRNDLQWIDVSVGRRKEKLIIDPLNNRFARLDSSLVKQLSNKDSENQEIDDQVVQDAFAAGLLQCRPTKRRSVNRWQWLALRLPGWPADRLASWLAERTDFLFSPVAILFWMASILAAGLAIPVCWERFQNNLPGLQHFFVAGSWVLLFATLLVTKLIHELAHGTVCRRMGARCGQIGILLMCGTPCPYCDVTDSWKIASPIRRAAVMLAGIYVELILAAIASAVWWFSSPGTLHFAALNVMVVCGASTLLFNLNPLMRYDGYYVLADALGSHNLREEALLAFRQNVVRPIAGPGYPVGRRPSARSLALSVYHIASSAYRLLIGVLIATWLYNIADAIALHHAGAFLASGIVLAMPAKGLRTGFSILAGNGLWQRVPWFRRVCTMLAIFVVVSSLLLIPFRRTEVAHGHVDVADTVNVFVPESARVASVFADYGTSVQAQQVLAHLELPDLNQKLTDLNGKLRTAERQKSQLRRQALRQPDLLNQLDAQDTEISFLAAQANTLQQRLDRLTIIAPAKGSVLPVYAGDASSEQPLLDRSSPSSPKRLTDTQADLRAAKQLIDAKGAWTTEGAQWCRIGNPNMKQVILEVDATQRRFVNIGDRIRVRCEQSPGRIQLATVRSISTLNLTEQNAWNRASRFQIACSVAQDVGSDWRIGATVTAHIPVKPQSLGSRMVAWWLENLRVG